ncbi:MAG: outer membrane protein transport protein, partial [Verrucomicrobia bacterium]|nr:outer membrane protein transport protein [Verrucomicrobiota bacterium]
MKRRMRILIGGGLISCLLFQAGAARAAEANYQQYLLGDRGAGMGGGVCAIAEGVEACYYNPAGLARTPNNTLSLSANLYGFQRYTVENALFPGENFDANSFHSVPSSAGGTYRMDTNLVLGFAVFAPRKIAFFETIAFPESQHYYTLSQDHQTLWLGPSAGYQATPALALGGSIYGVYDTVNSQQALYWGD